MKHIENLNFVSFDSQYQSTWRWELLLRKHETLPSRPKTADQQLQPSGMVNLNGKCWSGCCLGQWATWNPGEALPLQGIVRSSRNRRRVRKAEQRHQWESAWNYWRVGAKQSLQSFSAVSLEGISLSVPGKWRETLHKETIVAPEEEWGWTLPSGSFLLCFSQIAWERSTTYLSSEQNLHVFSLSGVVCSLRELTVGSMTTRAGNDYM